MTAPLLSAILAVVVAPLGALAILSVLVACCDRDRHRDRDRDGDGD